MDGVRVVRTHRCDRRSCRRLGRGVDRKSAELHRAPAGRRPHRSGPGARYATLVHPAAAIPGSAILGGGTVVLAGVVATTGVRVGAHVVVMPHVVFTHDDVVEDFATFGTGVALAGNVHVGTGAYIGAGALVREKRTIGPWALVGMGAAVTSDIPAGEVWAGIPARYLRRVELPDDLRAEFGMPATEPA